ncbi:Mfs general substrate transporter [Neofusicoccum parvum]|uniref:Mfs general substrate transporter n=1 Tax=Neofusicoccum parvum TaxID=310453 RepID=A0ACB5SEN4_9PEZI|nr:Mfs general substrate transporter [Neofusicoccum parvum]
MDRADLEQVHREEHAPRAENHDAEGGLQSWLTVAGSALVYFASFGYMNSFGFFQDYYQHGYLENYAPSSIAFIGTLQLGLMNLVGPVAGVLFDAYGLNGVLFGLTVAFGTQTALAVAGQHFRRRRSFAMGIVAGGSSAGGVCLPIMFSRLVPLIGFGWAVRIAALILLCCYVIAILISRPKLAPKRLKSAADVFDFSGFRDMRYSVLAAANLVGNLGLYVPYYYIGKPFWSTVSYLLPLINASSFFGRIIGGFAADHTGRLNILYPVTTLSGVLCLTTWLPASNPTTVIAFTCLYGFCSGIFISVMPSAVAQISPEEKIGARLGAFSSVSAVAVLIGTPIGGSFVKNGTLDEYEKLIVYAGVTTTTAGLLILAARLLCERDLRKRW